MIVSASISTSMRRLRAGIAGRLRFRIAERGRAVAWQRHAERLFAQEVPATETNDDGRDPFKRSKS